MSDYLVVYKAATTYEHFKFPIIDQVKQFIKINPNLDWVTVLDTSTGRVVDLSKEDIISAPLVCVCGKNITFRPRPDNEIEIFTCECGEKFMPKYGLECDYPVRLITTKRDQYWTRYESKHNR